MLLGIKTTMTVSFKILQNNFQMMVLSLYLHLVLPQCINSTGCIEYNGYRMQFIFYLSQGGYFHRYSLSSACRRPHDSSYFGVE